MRAGAWLLFALFVSACRDGRPDLVAMPHDAGSTFEWRSFDPDACEVRSGCVGAPGDRALLHYRFQLANSGGGPVTLPHGGGCNPKSAKGFVRWELLGSDGRMVRSGTSDLPVGELSAGASVEAPGARGPCTWADVTGVEAGTYQLRLTVNADQAVAESRPENDTVTQTVTVPSALCRGKTCGASCCPPNTECLAGGNGCQMPDLTVDEPTLKESVSWSLESFPANDCAIDEGCVTGAGDRKLLRFTTSTPNVGAADFYIGNPEKNPNALYAQCHGHYHYHQYSSYRLVSSDGHTVATGRKQAFCAFDHTKVDAGAGPGKYYCDNQGITPGWTDIYEAHLDCQWIDVTDVTPGAYTLEVEVNPARLIAESSYANNVARVPVTVPEGDGCAPLPEVCADGQDNDCDGLADEGCNPIAYNERCGAVHYLQLPGEYTAAITPTTAADFSTGCGGAGGDLVFHFSLLVPELVYLSTYGSTVDTVISVRDGECATGAETACVDDACGVGQGHIAKVMAAGTHWVVVKAKQPGAAGTVKLTYQRSTCAGAKEISGPSTVAGDTSASPDNFLLACGAHGGHGRGGADELWYLTSCPGQTSLTVSTCGTAFDTAISVKPGSCRGRDVACNDDACEKASSVTVPLTKPGMWFVVVDGVGPEEKGPYILKATY